MMWRCGNCGARREADGKPSGPCTRCGYQAWEELLPGEENDG